MGESCSIGVHIYGFACPIHLRAEPIKQQARQEIRKMSEQGIEGYNTVLILQKDGSTC